MFANADVDPLSLLLSKNLVSVVMLFVPCMCQSAKASSVIFLILACCDCVLLGVFVGRMPCGEDLQFGSYLEGGRSGMSTFPWTKAICLPGLCMFSCWDRPRGHRKRLPYPHQQCGNEMQHATAAKTFPAHCWSLLQQRFPRVPQGTVSALVPAHVAVPNTIRHLQPPCISPQSTAARHPVPHSLLQPARATLGLNLRHGNSHTPRHCCNTFDVAYLFYSHADS